MKTKFIFLKILFAVYLLLICSMNLHASGLEISLIPSVYGSYNISCFGSQDGSIALQIDNAGTPPYTYKWSNDATTQNISGLAAGYYHVQITDSSGDMT